MFCPQYGFQSNYPGKAKKIRCLRKEGKMVQKSQLSMEFVTKENDEITIGFIHLE